jgi:DNA-binding response OmpR family regulator
MNGDDLAARLLNLRKDLPVILCTGYSDKITKNDALNMGIKRYFQKPVDSRELVLSIKELIETKH